MIKLDEITEMEIKDGILTISQFDNNEVILTQDNLKKLLEAINYTHCCKSDSELLIAFHEFLQTNYCHHLFDSEKIKVIEEFEATNCG